MSYEPTVWKSGDVVTSAKMNKLEQGVAGGGSGGGVLTIALNPETGALDKTWKEIHDAMASGKLAIVLEEDGHSVYHSIISALNTADNRFNVFVVKQNFATDDPLWAAESIDGYPEEL